jgi:hypothetical protein
MRHKDSLSIIDKGLLKCKYKRFKEIVSRDCSSENPALRRNPWLKRTRADAIKNDLKI